jgi:putative membrane protein
MPEATTPDTAPILALPVVGRRAEGYLRPLGAGVAGSVIDLPALSQEDVGIVESTTGRVPSLDPSARLAVDRTRLAYERTMLAWIRTGTSLITFGFGVYKFFQIERKPSAQDYLIGPHEFGLILVGTGLVALALAALEYRQNIRSLGTDYLGKQSWMPIAFAGLIAALGILAFVVMLLRQ